MTEQEYNDLTDLQRLINARQILNDIVPANSKTITEKPFREAMKTLYEFQEKLTDEILIKQL